MANKERAPTQYVELRGKVKWAKIFEQNRDLEGPNGAWKSHGGKTSLNLYIDKEQFKDLKAAGSQKQLKVDDDGNTYVTLDRKWEAPYTYGGPPQVLHADGKTAWDLETDGYVGNDSECAVIVSVYDTGTYRGTRMDTVQVIDHVVYESDYDGPVRPEPKDYTKGETTSTKAKANAKKAAKKVEEDLDDEIPFD